MRFFLLFLVSSCLNSKTPKVTSPAPVQNITTNNTCIFNGQVLSDGAEIEAFQNSTVPFGSTCVSEQRKCQAGSLTGSYSFSNCAVGVPASCLFDSVTIPHGGFATAYLNSTVPFGGTCTIENRRCQNGTLEGSFQFSSCSVGGPSGCLFNGVSIQHGNSVESFLSSSVSFGNACVSQSRTCDNGVLSGGYSFASCEVGEPNSCLLNGQTISHGSNRVAYESSTVPFGSVCVSEQRGCNNGILSGSFDFLSCQVGAPASCLFNGQTVAHGSGVIAFPNSTVPFGNTCTYETRQCSNGVLSGNNEYSTCAVNAPASCLFNGRTLAHGESVNAYESSSVSQGQSCSKQSRICSNGVLSGSFEKDSCVVRSLYLSSYNVENNYGHNAWTSESGRQITLDVRPLFAPEAGTELVIVITSSDRDEIDVLDGRVSFNSLNWNTSKKIRISGHDDSVLDSYANITITAEIENDPVTKKEIYVTNFPYFAGNGCYDLRGSPSYNGPGAYDLNGALNYCSSQDVKRPLVVKPTCEASSLGKAYFVRPYEVCSRSEVQQGQNIYDPRGNAGGQTNLPLCTTLYGNSGYNTDWYCKNIHLKNVSHKSFSSEYVARTGFPGGASGMCIQATSLSTATTTYSEHIIGILRCYWVVDSYSWSTSPL